MEAEGIRTIDMKGDWETRSSCTGFDLSDGMERRRGERDVDEERRDGSPHDAGEICSDRVPVGNGGHCETSI